MKHLLYAFGAVLLLAACQKDPSEPVTPIKPIIEEPIISTSNAPVFFHGDTSQGAASAIKIDKKWKASAYSDVVKRNGSWSRNIILFTYTNDSRFIREVLDFSSIPYDCIGKTFSIVNGSKNPGIPVGTGYARIESHSDVVAAFYSLDNTSKFNYLKITKCDTLAKRIEGEFHVSYVIKPPSLPTVSEPGKVRFSSGKFWANIQ